jgi:hypothetical protein
MRNGSEVASGPSSPFEISIPSGYERITLCKTAILSSLNEFGVYISAPLKQAKIF